MSADRIGRHGAATERGEAPQAGTTMTTMVEMLIGMGGRRWTKGGHDRVYIPVALSCDMIGLRVSRYGSGNVSSATLNGDRISNTMTREMLTDLDGIYYDVAADKFTSCHGVASALRARLASAVAS